MKRLKNLIANKKIAVGVSGGADSLALVLMLKEKGLDLVALTVDHGLRIKSCQEALYVAQIMQNFGIEHHILHWKGEKPQTGVEEKARIARYELLSTWCHDNNVDDLYIAHHSKDQAETFMMRLARGSGIDGLAAMGEQTDLFGVNIVRPLLNTNPNKAKDYLQAKNIAWVEDESNDSDDYLRVRARKILPILEKELGLSVERLCKTAKAMARAKDFLEQQTNDYINHNVQVYEKAGVCFDCDKYAQLHSEIGLRVLAQLLINIGGNNYRPRFESLEALYNNLLKDNFKTQTLNNCVICVFNNKIWLIKECKNCRKSKKEWEDFVAENPIFAKLKLPSKLRIALQYKKEV